ncbi:hypothetical protein DL765_006601 [Monosporascus sp. GIB2]|nr:hypothetical protein DL765_006601 [Monosporascus sp. GIB2]
MPGSDSRAEFTTPRDRSISTGSMTPSHANLDDNKLHGPHRFARPEDDDVPIRKALKSVAQNDRREMLANLPGARDEAEQRRDPVKFVGAAVPPVGPLLAWVLLRGGSMPTSTESTCRSR